MSSLPSVSPVDLSSISSLVPTLSSNSDRLETLNALLNHMMQERERNSSINSLQDTASNQLDFLSAGANSGFTRYSSAAAAAQGQDQSSLYGQIAVSMSHSQVDDAHSASGGYPFGRYGTGATNSPPVSSSFLLPPQPGLAPAISDYSYSMPGAAAQGLGLPPVSIPSSPHSGFHPVSHSFPPSHPLPLPMSVAIPSIPPSNSAGSSSMPPLASLQSGSQAPSTALPVDTELSNLQSNLQSRQGDLLGQLNSIFQLTNLIHPVLRDQDPRFQNVYHTFNQARSRLLKALEGAQVQDSPSRPASSAQQSDSSQPNSNPSGDSQSNAKRHRPNEWNPTMNGQPQPPAAAPAYPLNSMQSLHSLHSMNSMSSSVDHSTSSLLSMPSNTLNSVPSYHYPAMMPAPPHPHAHYGMNPMNPMDHASMAGLPAELTATLSQPMYNPMVPTAAAGMSSMDHSHMSSILSAAAAANASASLASNYHHHMQQARGYGVIQQAQVATINSASAGSSNAAMRRPRFSLPPQSLAILRQWLFDHFEHPYPTEVEKRELAQATGCEVQQVNYWFINARVRIWRPLIEQKTKKRKLEEIIASVGINSEQLQKTLKKLQSEQSVATKSDSGDSKGDGDGLEVRSNSRAGSGSGSGSDNEAVKAEPASATAAAN